ALLPAVLTSDVVFDPLKDMYVLAQHLIHMTAGPDLLNKYTSNSPHSCDEDHPAGIIYSVLKAKFEGKPSNFPHKIIYTLWQHRETLLHDIQKGNPSAASDRTKSDYKSLISCSESWWNLLRMFKMSHLPGLGLTIPKAFHVMDPDKQKQLLSTLEQKRLSNPSRPDAPESVVPEPAGIPSQQSPEPATNSRSRSPSLVVEPPPADSTPTYDALPAHNHEIHKRKEQGSECETNKRMRVSVSSSTTDMDEYLPDSPVLDHGARESHMHRHVKKQLQHLSDRVHEKTPEEVLALHHLLDKLIQLESSPHLSRVMDALSQKIPGLTQRATKAEMVSEAATQHWRGPSSDEHEGI
ncbi:hypothetical protein FRC07_009265, partial [Ceratobasidium sp. 392]